MTDSNLKSTEKSSGIAEIYSVQNKSTQKISRKNESSISSTQTSTSCIRKSPSYSGTLPYFFMKPEIKSVVDKIVFLNKCYVCILTHQKVFISKEFACSQRKFIREYRALLHQENLRLRAMLRTKHGLKFEDVTKLIAFGSLKPQRIEPQRPVNVHSFGHRNKIMQIQTDKITDDIKNDTDDKFKTSCMRPQRNQSYNKSIQEPESNSSKEWELKVTPDGKTTMEEREKTALVPLENEFNEELITAVTTNEKITDFNAGMHEEVGKYQEEIHLAERVNDLIKENSTYSVKTETEDETEKVKKMVKSKKEESVESNAEIGDNSKKKKKQKAKKSDFKKLRKPKKSFFSSLCPGGKVEEPTTFDDVICEECKLKYGIC